VKPHRWSHASAVCRSSRRRSPIDADSNVATFLDRIAAADHPMVVMLTGVAVAHLFEAADRLGRQHDLAAGLARATIVARGPKPVGALARRGISSTVPVSAPFTTGDVVTAIDSIAVEGRLATVVHYGERNEAIVVALVSRGAVVHELTVYEWRLPDDTGPLSTLIDRLIAGEIPILAFTSQVQVRHLLEVAGAARRDPLLAALSRHVLVAAVGPTCAAGCRAAGIHVGVVPEQPKLVPMLMVLAATYDASQSRI
jgi:uroporphyrinogen-III synthase